MMVARGYAHRRLPLIAYENRSLYDKCYCYEEDCDINIPLFFDYELIPKMVDEFYPDKTEEEKRELAEKHCYYTVSSIARWNPGLYGIGIEAFLNYVRHHGYVGRKLSELIWDINTKGVENYGC